MFDPHNRNVFAHGFCQELPKEVDSFIDKGVILLLLSSPPTGVCVTTGASLIPPIWFGLAFLRTRLPCSDPTTDDKNSRVELAVGT